MSKTKKLIGKTYQEPKEIQLIQEIQYFNKLLSLKHKLAQNIKRDPTFDEWADFINYSTKELKTIIYKANKAKENLLKDNLKQIEVIAKLYRKKTEILKSIYKNLSKKERLP